MASTPVPPQSDWQQNTKYACAEVLLSQLSNVLGPTAHIYMTICSTVLQGLRII
jgi:hypothetical protein